MNLRDTAVLDRVRTLDAQFDRRVDDADIDENGHMNVSSYFRWGVWAPWLLCEALGMDERYREERQLSFFTVEHHLRYLSELRHGERYTVRGATVDRTGKALHLASFVVDEERDRIACLVELMYVHVSLETRRSAPVPDELAARLDASIASTDWVRPLATGLTLRR